MTILYLNKRKIFTKKFQSTFKAFKIIIYNDRKVTSKIYLNILFSKSLAYILRYYVVPILKTKMIILYNKSLEYKKKCGLR